MGKTREVYIVGAKRSAIGRFTGSFKDLPASEMLAQVIVSVLEEGRIDPELVEEVIVGTILSAGQKMGPARQASIFAGIANSVPAWAVNMLCGSGMKSIMTAADEIRLGRVDICVAGGMENMSRAPYLLPAGARTGTDLGSVEMRDHIIEDGLMDVFNGYHMGVTAENIARMYHLTREEQDAFALESQRRTAIAVDEGYFSDEICPVKVPGHKGTVTVTRDEHPRPDTTPEELARLQPAFDRDGTVTAGNASGINDGASAVVLASGEAVDRHGLTPRARIADYDQAGVDPAYMGMGPVPAIERALKRAGTAFSEMDLIELNEAFAAQSLGVVRELACIHGESETSILARTNVNGGAIALWHPIGASGNRIVVTLLHEMERRGVSRGLASLCIGGGMGTAMILERL